MEWNTVLSQIEDLLFPKLGLTVSERVIYYHLLRLTWVREQETTQCSIDGMSAGVGLSTTKAREALRSLHAKGCIKIENRSRAGHKIRVILPSQLSLSAENEERAVDLATVDFFSGRPYLDALLARESSRCFYCLRDVTRETCELDHVNPQLNGIDNSYRNIVISCHECNKLKQDLKGEEHLRQVFRKCLLSESEFQERMLALEALRNGDLVPEL